MKERLANLVLLLSAFVAVGVLGYEFALFVKSFRLPAQTTAAGPPAAPDPNEVLTPIDRGRIVFLSAGCQACHSARLSPQSPEAGGAIGPSLSNVARRRSEADLRKQLIDPEAVARGSYMPSFASLPAEEMEALIAFLKIMDQTYEPAAEPRLQIPLDASGRPRFSPEQVDRGAQLFLAQCLGCHTVGRQGAPLGPNLTREALRGRTDAWQLQHLKDPLSVYVMGPTEGLPWLMPRFDHLSDEDLQALVAYIQSLH